MRARTLTFAFTMLCCAAAAATELRLNITKQPIKVDDEHVLYVAFASDPLTAQVTMTVNDLPIRRVPAAEQARLQALAADAWWRDITWTLRDRATGAERPLANADLRVEGSARTEHGPRLDGASVPYVAYEARITFPPMPAGDYALTAKLASLASTDTFNVRVGTEAPRLRSAYLERAARAARTFAEYERIQLERLAATPNDATILTALAGRACVDGTESAATQYYDRAIAVVRENTREHARKHPDEAKNVAASGDAMVRSLEEAKRLVPELFQRHGELQLDQAKVNGAWHYVLRDRTSQRIVRVAQ